MFGLDILSHAVSVELTRAITGRLFNEDQIRSVTKSAVGRYFADWFPEPADERTAKERVEEARLHIGKASSIITDMQEELSQQSTQLDKLLVEVEEKKKLAEKYGQLAATNQQQFAAFRNEMEEILRMGADRPSGKGKEAATSNIGNSLVAHSRHWRVAWNILQGRRFVGEGAFDLTLRSSEVFMCARESLNSR